MLKLAGVAFLLCPVSLVAQAIPAGRWDIVSTAVDLQIPGAPAFLLRMMKGKSKSEHKCILADQAGNGVAALLLPDPKVQCRVDSLQITDGRYKQTVSCPQKSGPAIRIERTGVYGASGFSGRLVMASETTKGTINITLDQKAIHLAGICKG